MAIDKANMKQVLKDFPKQCREAVTLAQGIKVTGKFNKILVCGMGGSAIGGDILKSVLFDKIPVFVVKDYDVPEFIDDKTLVFAISYSGNTEETLGACVKAKNKGATTVGITSGGQLEDLADTIIRIPSGLQPRNAVGYLFFPMLGVLFNSGLINISNSDLNELLKVVSDVEYFEEKGKEIALKIKQKTPIIYTSSVLESAGYRFKCEINENAKHPAYHHVFPELCHNELVGYSGMERSKFVVILVNSDLDHERTQLRMNICKDLFDETVDVVEVTALGTSLLSKLFSTIYLGDWVSYHLAIHKRIDPSPVDVIENLKRKLKE